MQHDDEQVSIRLCVWGAWGGGGVSQGWMRDPQLGLQPFLA
jgi:hypothetical protein